MDAQKIFELMNANPVFYLATMDEEQPRVRGMLLYRADENGIIFHTASTKDVYAQIKKNPKAELCFFGNGVQVRVSGVLEEVVDEGLKQEIYAHPTRKFLRDWKEQGIGDDIVRIFNLKNGSAVTWSMDTNFEPKKVIML